MIIVFANYFMSKIMVFKKDDCVDYSVTKNEDTDMAVSAASGSDVIGDGPSEPAPANGDEEHAG